MKALRDPRLLLGLAVTLLLAVMAVNVFDYVWHMGSPILRGDDWYYSNTIVKSYLDGHLGIMDFFDKRAAGENAQPINRLVLLGLVKWFHMDFSVQGLLGALLAMACVVVLSGLALREPAPAGQPWWARLLLPLGFGVVILSLNAEGDYSWPLVTALVYTGTLGISLYLYFAAGLATRGAWLRLALLTFAVLVLLDTFATLAVLGAVLLVLSRIPGSQSRWRTAGSALAVFAALEIYQHLFTWLTGTTNSPLGAEELLAAAGYLLHHFDESWKLMVAPFGGALFIPRQSPHTWAIMAVLSVPMWLLHAWFWWTYARERSGRIGFLAGGLMLYCYGTVAGMLVDRIPNFSLGFDYLLQPRYVAFYQLQLLAILLMWSRVGMPRLEARRYAAAAAVAGALLLWLNLHAAEQAWRVQPFAEKRYQAVAVQIQQMAQDPAHLPADCFSEITPCGWPEEQRRQVLELLASHQLNVFSPELRARHGYAEPGIPVNP